MLDLPLALLAFLRLSSCMIFSRMPSRKVSRPLPTQPLIPKPKCLILLSSAPSNLAIVLSAGLKVLETNLAVNVGTPVSLVQPCGYANGSSHPKKSATPVVAVVDAYSISDACSLADA